MSGAAARNITDVAPIVGVLRGNSADRAENAKNAGQSAKDLERGTIGITDGSKGFTPDNAKMSKCQGGTGATLEIVESTPLELIELLPESITRPLQHITDPVHKEMLLFGMITAAWNMSDLQ